MNPFIEFAKDPVAVLTGLAYAMALLALVGWTFGLVWSNAMTAYAQYKANWSSWDYLPPLSWISRVAAIPTVLAIDAWALAALLWLIGL